MINARVLNSQVLDFQVLKKVLKVLRSLRSSTIKEDFKVLEAGLRSSLNKNLRQYFNSRATASLIINKIEQSVIGNSRNW